MDWRRAAGDALLFEEPLPSHATDASRGVLWWQGAPRAVIAKRLQHHFFDSEELVEFFELRGCLGLSLDGAHVPRILQVMRSTTGQLGWVEEDAG